MTDRTQIAHALTARPEVAVTLPPGLLDRLRRESLAGGWPLSLMVAGLVAALMENPDATPER